MWAGASRALARRGFAALHRADDALGLGALEVVDYYHFVLSG